MDTEEDKFKKQNGRKAAEQEKDTQYLDDDSLDDDLIDTDFFSTEEDAQAPENQEWNVRENDQKENRP